MIGAAQEVHRLLGPGLLEGVYEEAMAHELRLRSSAFERQKLLPMNYKGLVVGEFRPDFVAEGKIILELKAAAALAPVHQSQAVHYLAMTGLRLAILINFGRASLQIRRIVRQVVLSFRVISVIRGRFFKSCSMRQSPPPGFLEAYRS